jgi:hypothetical protein
MSKVIAIIALGLIAYYWSYTQKLKACAIRGAKKRCQEAGIQFLDHTVVYNKMCWQNNTKGKKRLHREYFFDFTSTGEDRYVGKIYLQAHHVVGVELGVYSIN